jgi:hypothetical protein
MSCELIVFTHSDYQDIWPIVLDSLNAYVKGIPVGIAVNSKADTSIFTNLNIYTYDDSNPYGQRLVDVCQQITSDYIFLYHDVDILMTFDTEKCKQIVSWMEVNQVDRFLMGVLPSKTFRETLGDIPIGKSGPGTCDWFTTPYDVGPSIWNRKTLFDLMSKHRTETYRTIESSAIQEDLSTKNVYGFCKGNFPIFFTIGRPYSGYFAFCHLFVRGKWIPPLAYQSFVDFFVSLPEKYQLDIEKRGIADFYHGMTSGFTIS